MMFVWFLGIFVQNAEVRFPVLGSIHQPEPRFDQFPLFFVHLSFVTIAIFSLPSSPPCSSSSISILQHHL